MGVNSACSSRVPNAESGTRGGTFAETDSRIAAFINTYENHSNPTPSAIGILYHYVFTQWETRKTESKGTIRETSVHLPKYHGVAVRA